MTDFVDLEYTAAEFAGSRNFELRLIYADLELLADEVADEHVNARLIEIAEHLRDLAITQHGTDDDEARPHAYF